MRLAVALICCLLIAWILWLILHQPDRRLASIALYDPTTGEILVTTIVPSNGTARLGVRYLDQFGAQMPPPVGAGFIEDDPNNLAEVDMSLAGNELMISGRGIGQTGSLSVAAEADGVVSPRVFLSVQDPALTRIEVDEAGVHYEAAKT